MTMGTKPGPARKSPFIWLMLLATMFFLYRYFSAPVALPYAKVETSQEFYTPLNEHKITSVTFVTAVGKAPYISWRETGGPEKRLWISTESYPRYLEEVTKNAIPYKEIFIPPSPWGFLLSFIPMLLIFAFLIFMMRRAMGGGAGGGNAFTFGKSRAKLHVPDDLRTVTFADVAGADEAKSDLSEFVEFLKNPTKFTRLGGKLPSGALLVGQPGTGKTLLARAIAGEAGRPFFSISGSDFVEMFVGVGASRVRDLFEEARNQAPCIVFIDEIDAVGRRRGAGLGGGHDEREQTLNQLLVEMDGFSTTIGVILIAATNRPDVLDPALLRPGRFDRQVIVDIPDINGREAILKVHARNKPLAANVDLRKIARGTPGMVGADLANLINEAALLAARHGHESVTEKDLEDAKDKILMGAERKSMVLSEEERRITAYHEAGHAIVAIKTKGSDPIHKVTIIPRGRALGVTASLPERDRHNYTKEWMLGRLAMLYGGRAAEEIIFGKDKITTGASNDIERATQLARQMIAVFGMSTRIGPIMIAQPEQEVFLGRDIVRHDNISERTAQIVDEEIKTLAETAYEKALKLLTDNFDLLDLMATELLNRETLDAEDVLTLAAGTPLPPLV
jgi:cell division protease FtsH